jgi:hypothetical protein
VSHSGKVVLHLVDHSKVVTMRRRQFGNQPQQQAPAKFRRRCAKLEGHIFCCSDCKQADAFVNTVKRISKCAGAEHEHGGDIGSSIIHKEKSFIPVPVDPSVLDADNLSPEERVAKLKDELLEDCIKRKSRLDDNFQKVRSLVDGQCAKLIQRKLECQAQQATVRQD